MLISDSNSGWNLRELLKKYARIIIDFAKEYEGYNIIGESSVPIKILTEFLNKLPNGDFSKEEIDEINEIITKELRSEIKRCRK